MASSRKIIATILLGSVGSGLFWGITEFSTLFTETSHKNIFIICGLLLFALMGWKFDREEKVSGGNSDRIRVGTGINSDGDVRIENNQVTGGYGSIDVGSDIKGKNVTVSGHTVSGRTGNASQ